MSKVKRNENNSIDGYGLLKRQKQVKRLDHFEVRGLKFVVRNISLSLFAFSQIMFTEKT